MAINLGKHKKNCRALLASDSRNKQAARASQPDRTAAARFAASAYPGSMLIGGDKNTPPAAGTSTQPAPPASSGGDDGDAGAGGGLPGWDGSPANTHPQHRERAA